MAGHPSRRAFLAATGATFAAAWLRAGSGALHASLRHARGPAGSWDVLTAEQAADFDAISAQIIPTDDTPGAREAGVVRFIDHALATWAAAQRTPLLEGLARFNADVAKRWTGVQRFAQLDAARQLAFLREHEQAPFFQEVRFATIVGMFSLPSYGGNQDKIGWQLLGFEDRFAWQPPFGAYDAEAR